MFVYGWTQYLWPLLVTNDNRMNTTIIALRKMISFADADTPSNLVMATTILALIPPVLVVIAMQKVFVKGLIESDKQEVGHR
jgi:sn-glycerol 3-phosphate transport system permease protein